MLRCKGGAEAVQGRCRWCREGAGEVQAVQGGAGYLHRLHLSKHNVRCREVQGVQAHLRDYSVKPHRGYNFLVFFTLS